MLSVHIDDVLSVYECQPLLSPSVSYPRPGSCDDAADEQRDDEDE